MRMACAVHAGRQAWCMRAQARVCAHAFGNRARGAGAQATAAAPSAAYSG